jgi:hypothetical protein
MQFEERSLILRVDLSDDGDGTVAQQHGAPVANP